MNDNEESVEGLFGQTLAYLGDLGQAYHELLMRLRAERRRADQLEVRVAELQGRLARLDAKNLPAKKLNDLLSQGL